jgi:hypothetical protein
MINIHDVITQHTVISHIINIHDIITQYMILSPYIMYIYQCNICHLHRFTRGKSEFKLFSSNTVKIKQTVDYYCTFLYPKEFSTGIVII